MTSSLSSMLLGILGKNVASPEVEQVIKEYALADIQDDPPSRRYLGSMSSGLSLLFHDDRLIDVQFYAKPTKKYQSYAQPLPFGIEKGMRQEGIHRILGEPAKSDETYSRYLRLNDGIKLVIEYDKTGVVRYVSASLLAE